MSWHIAGYTGSIAGTANTDLPAVPDQVLTLFNGHPLLSRQMSLIAAYAGGALLLRARLDSPTLRFFGNPFIRPVDPTANPPSNYNWDMNFDNPFVLPAGEEIAVQVSNSGAGPTRTNAFIILQDFKESIGPGNIYPVRFTSVGPAVANVWADAAIVFDTAFPTGRFNLLLSELFSTTILAHRWLFDEQVYRPGFISTPVVTARYPNELYTYPLGKMGSFMNTSLPRLQVFCTAADASFEGYAYIQKAA